MKPVLFFIALSISVSTTQSAETNLPGVGVAATTGAFGGGAGRVSMRRDSVGLSYPDSISPSSSLGGAEDKRSQSSRLLMTKPERLEKDGIYIWRDAFGVWNIAPVSSRGLRLHADISTDGRVEALGEQAAVFGGGASGKTSFDLSVESGAVAGALQFRATGGYVDFDFLIDGKREASQVYLGIDSLNPKTVGFRLENRGLLRTGADPGSSLRVEPLVYGAQRTDASLGSQEHSPPQSQPTGGGGGGAGGRRGQ